MPLPASERRAKLEAIKRSLESKGTLPITWKSTTPEALPFYLVPLSNLVWNRYNDRIAVQMLSDQAINGGYQEEYNETLEEKILDYIWHLNPEKNKQDLDHIKKNGQLIPGVVTADGVIVSGNRRAMLLKRAGLEFFKAVILEDAYEDQPTEIQKLETLLQFGEPDKADYEPLAKYLKYKKMRDAGLDSSQIAEFMGEDVTKSKVEECLRIMDVMDDYLSNHLDAPGQYYLLKKADGRASQEEAFIQLATTYHKIKDGKLSASWPYEQDRDAIRYKTTMFNLIRSEAITNPQEWRLVGAPGKKEKTGGIESSPGIMASKEIFESFVSKVKASVKEADTTTQDLRTYKENEKNVDLKDLHKKRESDWRSTRIEGRPIGKILAGAFNEARQRRQREVAERDPLVALKNIDGELVSILGQEDWEGEAFVENEDAINLVRKISAALEQIKKAMGLSKKLKSD